MKPKTITPPSEEKKTITIPVWQSIAKTYPKAVQIVLDKIAKKQKFYSYVKVDAEHLRETAQKHAWMLGRTKREKITFQFQMGEKYKGVSVQDVRSQISQNTEECGLGVYEVAQIFLKYPDTLKSYDDLWIYCSGDEYAPDADGQFGLAPYFYFNGGELKFGAYWVSSAVGFFGSASGFSPQSKLDTRNLDGKIISIDGSSYKLTKV